MFSRKAAVIRAESKFVSNPEKSVECKKFSKLLDALHCHHSQALRKGESKV